MSLKNFIWIGEIVEYQGKRSTIFDINVPMVLLIHADGSQEEVHFKKIRKIRDSGVIYPINN